MNGKKAVSTWPVQFKYVSDLVNDRRPDVPETLVSEFFFTVA